MTRYLALLLLIGCNAKATAWDVEPSDATGCQSLSSISPEPDIVCWDGYPEISCFTSFAACMNDPTRPAMAGCH